MPGRQDDELARAGSGVAEPPVDDRSRSPVLAAAVVVAVGATLAVFLTTDVRTLRIADIATAWACAATASIALHRRSARRLSRAREAQLRAGFSRELALSAAAARERELHLEITLRREAEDALRGGLAAVQADLAALAELRQELALATARVSAAATAHLLAAAPPAPPDGAPRPVPHRRHAEDERPERWDGYVPEHPDGPAHLDGHEPVDGPEPLDGYVPEHLAGYVADPVLEYVPEHLAAPAAAPESEHGAERESRAEHEPLVEAAEEPDGHALLTEILAESSPTTGERRRHRYREDDQPDEVLGRVLGGG